MVLVCPGLFLEESSSKHIWIKIKLKCANVAVDPHHRDDLNKIMPYSFCIAFHLIFLDFRERQLCVGATQLCDFYCIGQDQ